ncbi:SMP-30/gluconolactonase/LRE family protein [Variovorax dokdonensis]|uniref:SMP-30/gluconolactonase/LRE family protein n=1 Tax=Variovorax dokdonensis TaxID=344883 RepID=A0ABT7NFA1_9BURK|nr:SMP-30/gluconolactonase/LRE family protein [Variovorax dokdonensis]MDM0046621.1 SMP-30/gluconolactonase/LRE family protein [Variovorax dokdonensis]
MWQSIASSCCELGESPFWHPQERSLYWVDIPGRALLRTRGPIDENTEVQRWTMPSEPGCIAPARRGGLVVALRDSIYRAAEWGGELRCMARADHDVRTLRFNDGKCDPLGRFWAGSINEAKDGPTAALHCLDARPGHAAGAAASLVRMQGEVTTANGLAFAPEANRIYWADTPSHAVRVWDWDAQANRMSNEREFQRFAPKPAGWTPGAAGAPSYGGRPDGATLDAQGRYWAAMYEGAQLVCIDAAGNQVAAIPVPAQCPTMPCFGGDDLRTLFVTTGRHGRSTDELGRLPASGKVLFMRSQTQGRPVDFFED